MTKKLFLSFLLIGGSVFSQDEKDTLSLELISDVQKAGYINLSAQLFDLNLTGTHIFFGSGINFEASNIKDKFNFSGSYMYNYAVYDYTTGSNQVMYNINPKKTSFIDFNLGYTFKQSQSSKEESLTITKRGKTSYYTNVDTKSIKSQKVRLGFLGMEQINSGEQYNYITINDTTDFLVGAYSIYHKLNCIQIGYAETKSTRSTFNVAKFGKRFNFEEKTRYADLIIALPSTFPTISSVHQTEIANSFSKLPIGIRVGVKNLSSTHLTKRMIWGNKFELGVNPGYHTGIRSMATLLYFKMGLTINLFKEIH